MALRLRLLRSPPSPNGGDAEDGIVRVPVQSADQHYRGSFALSFIAPAAKANLSVATTISGMSSWIISVMSVIDMQPHKGPHIEVEWEPGRLC